MSNTTIEATRYAVSLHGDGDVFVSINVESHGDGYWAVALDGECMNASGEWSREPYGADQNDEWIDEFLFDYDTAYALAVQEVERQVREA